jgi:hypothetical protein
VPLPDPIQQRAQAVFGLGYTGSFHMSIIASLTKSFNVSRSE